MIVYLISNFKFFCRSMPNSCKFLVACVIVPGSPFSDHDYFLQK